MCLCIHERGIRVGAALCLPAGSLEISIAGFDPFAATVTVTVTVTMCVLRR